MPTPINNNDEKFLHKFMRNKTRILSPQALAAPVFKRTLFIHAHPDDEAIQSGGLIAGIVAHGYTVGVLTCTRGEEGEFLPGTLPDGAGEDHLVALREKELFQARTELGVSDGFWLGTPPAAAGKPHKYRDSGMVWVTEGQAGPSPHAGENAFSLTSLEQQTADACALINEWQPTAIIGYDSAGSYGHPDHTRAHELAHACAAATGVPHFELASTRNQEQFTYIDCLVYAPVVEKALRCYASQLEVVASPQLPDWQIRHVGGQYQEAPLWPGLRRTQN